MDIKQQKKQELILKITDKIQTGEWGLQHINYIHEHKHDYNLDNSDVGLLLTELYRQAYVFAMEDGILNDLERENLLKIKYTINNFNLRKPVNRYELNNLKTKIHTITRDNLEHNFDEVNVQHELRGIRNFPKLRLRPPGSRFDPFDIY